VEIFKMWLNRRKKEDYSWQFPLFPSIVDPNQRSQNANDLTGWLEHGSAERVRFGFIVDLLKWRFFQPEGRTLQ
jgi:hypothetical protein